MPNTKKGQGVGGTVASAEFPFENICAITTLL